MRGCWATNAPPQVGCWLVNTGWTGGPYGEGERISLPHTRAMLRAALERRARERPSSRHPEFGLMIPKLPKRAERDLRPPRHLERPSGL